MTDKTYLMTTAFDDGHKQYLACQEVDDMSKVYLTVVRTQEGETQKAYHLSFSKEEFQKFAEFVQVIAASHEPIYLTAQDLSLGA